MKKASKVQRAVDALEREKYVLGAALVVYWFMILFRTSLLSACAC